MKATFKINSDFARATAEELKEALFLTMESIRSDVEADQTMPMKDGTMENNTFVDVDTVGSLIEGVLTTDTPYARYQYRGIGPVSKKPFDYYKGEHANARSEWLEPYMHSKVLKARFIESLNKVRGDG